MNNSEDKILKESWKYIKTDVMAMADTLAEQATSIEKRFVERTEKIEIQIEELEKKLNKLQK